MNNKERNLKANLAASYNDLIQSFTALSVETVGNYTLGKVVGKGSYGKAYQATHKFVGGKVVLKSTPKSEAPNLAREIHHHRRLHHPHVAQLYEVIITENKVWLVLESCAGGELYDHLLKVSRLTEDETQRKFAQICGAVAYIHSRGIVHRDLKLENIFLDRKGNVKLGDFGFTRENDRSMLSTWCGSLLYCAPEIVRGEKYSGAAVDVWSLGIILYTLLSGHLPFDDDDENTTKTMILTQEPAYPSHFGDDVRELLTRMLSKNPQQRPSAKEVLGHAFLSMYSDPQLLHLENPYTPTFTTKMERTILERMTVAGIDIERLMNSVADYRCDALSGWWWLCLHKERRRERKFRAMSKRRSTDAAMDEVRTSQRRSRSRSAGPHRSLSGRAGLYDYKFPSNEDSRQHSRQNSVDEVSPRISQLNLGIKSPVPIKNSIFTQLKSGVLVKTAEVPENSSRESIHKPKTSLEKTTINNDNSNDTVHRPDEERGSDSSVRSKELGMRKSNILQTFRTWWSEQTKPVTKDKRSNINNKVVSTNTPTTIYVSSPSVTSSMRDKSRDRSGLDSVRPASRPTYKRRSSSGYGSTNRSASARQTISRRRNHAGLNLVFSEEDDRRNFQSPSPVLSSPIPQSPIPRPAIVRTQSASSNQSNRSSIHSHVGEAGNLVSYSKASSTSSNSTFASTRSMRSPRNPLKVMPSTPPPYMITHNGGTSERNIFDSRFAGASNGVAFATRNKGKRGVLLQTKQKARRSILLNEVEEEDEEEEDDFVDEAPGVRYPCDVDPVISSSRNLLDLAEEEEQD